MATQKLLEITQNRLKVLFLDQTNNNIVTGAKYKEKYGEDYDGF